MAEIDDGYIIKFLGDDLGRGVIATREFVKGQTILREQPLVSCQVGLDLVCSLKSSLFMFNLFSLPGMPSTDTQLAIFAWSRWRQLKRT